MCKSKCGGTYENYFRITARITVIHKNIFVYIKLLIYYYSFIMKRVYVTDPNTIHDTVHSSAKLVKKVSDPGGLQLVDPKAATKKSAHDLVALATEIQKADNSIKSNAHNKLRVIKENMRFLQKQAEQVLLEAQEHTMLHHAACNFVKKPGNIYHVYERPSGEFYFSMLSPEEWGKNSPSQTFKGSYRLEDDQSWTLVSQIKTRDAESNIFDKRLFKKHVLALNLPESMIVD